MAADLVSGAPFAGNVDPRLQARVLFWQGWRISDIARLLGLKPTVVYSWKTRDGWEGGEPLQRVAASAEMRLHFLINQPKKSDADYKEIRQLTGLLSGGRSSERPSERKRQEESGRGFDDVPTIDRPPREPRERVRKVEKAQPNCFSPEQVARAQEIFREQLFGYQEVWLNQRVRFRNLLKSRQIGATFFFAREALVDALLTGKNKVFLSASRRQAFQFKQYQIDLAQMVGVELKGDSIRLHNGAVLYFLGTNSRTAQSYHGDLYVDEYFWIQDFEELTRVAKPMASQKQYRITYFSTPSSTAHPAYPFWTGSRFNEGRPKAEHVKFDVSHAALSGGRLCEDGQWRQIVTLDDAEKSGCTLFDRRQLELENSPAEFRQLFMCEFVEDGDGVFSWADLKHCQVDSWVLWGDFFKPQGQRPAGDLPVWVGYDPAFSGDAAGLVVVLPPRHNGDKFRILEHKLLRGDDFERQAEEVRSLLGRYNVQKVVVDRTGLGEAVFQLVGKFFPRVIGVNYSLAEKSLMVNKMLSLLRADRVEWDSDCKDITAAFLNIRTFTTAGGRVSYESARTEASSHSDVAWAAMQVFYQEPLDGVPQALGTVEIY